MGSHRSAEMHVKGVFDSGQTLEDLHSDVSGEERYPWCTYLVHLDGIGCCDVQRVKDVVFESGRGGGSLNRVLS